MSQLIGQDWIPYATLQKLPTYKLIDHMLRCQKWETHYRFRDPSPSEFKDELWMRSNEYREQKMWCLQILQEQGIYAEDPYRDDK